MQLNKFIKKYWEYILALLIPLVIVLLHCVVRHVWLFGMGGLLKGDARIQYVDLYKELWNKVHNGDISFFSWNAVGGVDIYLNMLYYTISPATLIVLLLPKNCLEDALQVFLIWKWMLVSFSAVYFFMHTKFNTLIQHRRLVSLTFGLCYALSGSFLCTMFLFNWTDTLILFPFLLLLVERMVEKGTWRLYYICLTIAIFCNFYIAFPVCIFLFLWFVILMQTMQRVNKKVIGVFLGTSIWAAVSAMAVILPSIMNVKERYTYEQEGASNSLLSFVLSPADMIAKFFPFWFGNTDIMGSQFYMSIGIIVFCLLFCFIKMDKRVKYTKLGCLCFIVISCLVKGLNLVWHGFSNPHGFSPRYAFALIMLLAVMGLDVFLRIDQIRLWNCISVLVVGIVLFCYAFLNVSLYEEFYVYLFAILAFVWYCIILSLLCRKSIKRESFVLIFCILCILELCGNAYYQFASYDQPRSDEEELVEETIELSSDIQLEKGQRIVFDNAGFNGGMKTGFPTMSGFVSYTAGSVSKLMFDLGMVISVDSGVNYSGGTPLLDVMFNNAYAIGKNEVECGNADIVKKGKELNVYRIKELAGMGYMVKQEVTEWIPKQASPFETQNEFAKLATDSPDAELFRILIPKGLHCITSTDSIDTEQLTSENGCFFYQYGAVSDVDGNILEFIADRDMSIFFYLSSNVRVVLDVSIDDRPIWQYSKAKSAMTIPIGRVKEGQKVSITCAVRDQTGNEIQMMGWFAELKEDTWTSVYQALSKNVYEITDMQKDYISGVMETDEDGIMMTSVPAMNGFDVYVDGKQTGYHAIGGALIGVPLGVGKHVVEFKYHTPFAKAGWLISLCSIGLYIIVEMIGRRKNASVFCKE